MAYIWRLLNTVFPLTSGTPNMFMFCALIFWVALAIVAWLEGRTNARRVLFACLVGLPPPMFFMLAYIWKDYLMAVAMFLAYALLLLAERHKSKLALLGAVVALLLAYVTRHNGIFAVFPLSIWAAAIAFDLFNLKSSRFQRHYVKVLAGFALCVLLTVAKSSVEYRLVNGHTSFPLQIMLLYDVVGISVRTNDNWVPGCFDRKELSISLPYLRRRYDTFNSFQLLFPTDATLDIVTMRFLNERNDMDWLWTNWVFAVIRHPMAYLEHRTEMFLSTLDLAHSNMLLRDTYAGAPRGMPSWYILSPTALDGWGYMLTLLALAALVAAGRLRLERSIVALIYSGFAYGLAYFICAPGNDQRYYFWTIMACWVAVVSICTAKIQIPMKASRWWANRLSAFTGNRHQKGIP
jgi:hypothetical protein